jgi:hypothetical protein
MAPRDVPPQLERQHDSPQYVPQEEEPFEIVVVVPGLKKHRQNINNCCRMTATTSMTTRTTPMPTTSTTMRTTTMKTTMRTTTTMRVMMKTARITLF